jgi:hypothetical protein
MTHHHSVQPPVDNFKKLDTLAANAGQAWLSGNKPQAGGRTHTWSAYDSSSPMVAALPDCCSTVTSAAMRVQKAPADTRRMHKAWSTGVIEGG